ncbi:hypothetical protein U1Q18_017009 [Sarracenia purpurea var. burkii]
MASLFSPLLALFLLFNLQVSADIVFEDGYTVSTVLDGHKLNINPHSILPQVGSSDLVILDSSDSAFFTVSFTASQVAESVIKRLSGNSYGFSDGDLANAKFNKPKSFAVDLNGNIYVADRGNRAIRKISQSGVNTIAGGSKTQGKADGSGRNASFSDDFELTFIPERCALMICDHGNQLVRQINLKSQDCATGSQSGVSTWALALGLGVSCLLGLIVGFAVGPYITSHEGSNPLRFKETWKHYLISRGRQIPTFCFDIRNAAVSSTLFTVSRRFIMLSLSHLSLMFRINTVESRISHTKPASLLDSELLRTKEITKSQMFAEQLKDLIYLDGEVELPDTAKKIFEGDCHEWGNDMFSKGNQRINNMIQASIMGFEEQAKKSPLEEEPLVISSGLVKRR